MESAWVWNGRKVVIESVMGRWVRRKGTWARRRVLESKIDIISERKEWAKFRVISMLLSRLCGGTMNKKWQVFQQRQIIAWRKLGDFRWILPAEQLKIYFYKLRPFLHCPNYHLVWIKVSCSTVDCNFLFRCLFAFQEYLGSYHFRNKFIFMLTLEKDTSWWGLWKTCASGIWIPEGFQFHLFIKKF